MAVKLGPNQANAGSCDMSAPLRSIPPITVQEAFRCQEEPVPLSGGQGEAFRCGPIVLKPCHDAEEAGWIAQVCREDSKS